MHIIAKFLHALRKNLIGRKIVSLIKIFGKKILCNNTHIMDVRVGNKARRISFGGVANAFFCKQKALLSIAGKGIVIIEKEQFFLPFNRMIYFPNFSELSTFRRIKIFARMEKFMIFT